MKTNFHYNNNDEIISLIHKMFIEHNINQICIYPDGYTKYVFNKINEQIMPNIILSDEMPERYYEVDDYSTDGLMGFYSPESRSIIIYLQGIEKVRQKLYELHSEYYQLKKINLYADLLKIVILHELGHYLFHNMEFGGICWRDDDDDPHPFAPVFIFERVDEWIAQSFVYQCIKGEFGLLDTMIKISDIQPYAYKSYNTPSLKKYLEIEKWSRIISYLQYYRDKDSIKSEISKKSDIETILDIVENCIDEDIYNI
ncbi:MAG: hypothetical protein PHC34_11355 [Candidatus Gastranaerophilales bacterium]|nr:hypothetical protein [Candidatus Gastranaerophilales bacterium]